MARPARTTKSRRSGGVLLIAALFVLGAALLLPSAFAAGLGRLLADLWVTVMGAVAGLLGGVFGA